MIVTILAVTKAYDKFCIAGMTDEGKWIRPIPNDRTSRFWDRENLIRNSEFVKCGDVWSIEGQRPDKFEFTNHTEDFIVEKRKYIKRLSKAELIRFLREHVEGEQAFLHTVNHVGRSLCLLKAKYFYPQTSEYDGVRKPKIKFHGIDFEINNPHTKNSDYIVKDCKWSTLILNNHNLSMPTEIYFCIGLATPAPFNNIEYPQVIGLHTFPEYPYPSGYPD